MKFENNLIFLIKLFYYLTDQKVKTKALDILRTENFWGETENFFHHF